MDNKAIIHMRGIEKKYFCGMPNEIKVLNNIDLDIQQGELVSIIGESGSGKSTLMNIMGLLDDFTRGQYFIDNVNIKGLNDSQLSQIRNEKIGFVFQNFNLISRLSAVKNVELPLKYSGMKRKEYRDRALDLLDMVGMKSRINHQPNQLSGGQNQRVAIARALANDPAIILADEPTGALDSKTGSIIMDIFHKLNERGKTVVIITHSQEIANETKRIIRIRDGEVQSVVRK